MAEIKREFAKIFVTNESTQKLKNSASFKFKFKLKFKLKKSKFLEGIIRVEKLKFHESIIRIEKGRSSMNEPDICKSRYPPGLFSGKLPKFFGPLIFRAGYFRPLKFYGEIFRPLKNSDSLKIQTFPTP